MTASRVRSTSTKTGLITSYGLFWRVEEPGLDKKRRLSLFGWQGRGRDLRLADFSHQRGIYILYGRYGPHYVGLAGKDSLGSRLVRHLVKRRTRTIGIDLAGLGFVGSWPRRMAKAVTCSTNRLRVPIRLKEFPHVGRFAISSR